MVETLQHLPLALIDPTPGNREVRPERVAGLAASIAAVGLASPLECWRRPDGRYQLTGGHHRRLALERLGWPTAPCMVVAAPEDQAGQVARRLASNAARAELSAVDAYSELAELVALGYDVDQLAAVTGRSADWCRRRLALGELDPSVRYVADARGPRFAELLIGLPADVQRQMVRVLEEREPSLERWRDMLAESRRRAAERAQEAFTLELAQQTWDATQAAYTAPDRPPADIQPDTAPGTTRPAPLGVQEVAARCGVPRDTVQKWRRRGIGFPEPDGEVSGQPWWWPETVDAWRALERRPGRRTASA